MLRFLVGCLFSITAISVGCSLPATEERAEVVRSEAAQPAAPAGPAPTAKSKLRVLLVSHDPQDPKVPFPQMATERTYALYRERAAAFEKFLREHFEHVQLVYGADYERSMSDAVDVTVFDARPTPIKEAVRQVDDAGRVVSYRPEQYLPTDFDRPALLISENSARIGEGLQLKLDWL